MKKKIPLYAAAILVLGLVLLVVSCGGTAAPTTPTTPAAPTTPVAEPATEEAEVAGTPVIPHTLEGRDDCLQCHGEGAFKPFPADHAGRTNNTCTGCHQPAD